MKIGDKYNYLTVKRILPLGKVRVLCVCGTKKIVAAKYLKNGDTKSCGCFRKARMVRVGQGTRFQTTHGHTVGEWSPTFQSWWAMKQRCLNPNKWHYKHYGAKGVTIHPAWLEFEGFLRDVGERPEGMTLDRIDPTGNYEPGNVRWATPTEQNRNKRIAA